MRTLCLLAVICVGFAAACGSNGSGGAGAGGAPGAGGAAGMASSSTGGNAGTPGMGGALGTGGGVGAGGSPSGAGGASDGGTSDSARADAGGGDAGAVTDASGNSDARGDARGDAGTVYSPCPTSGSCIVMPLGDSITDGYPFENGGYRVEFFHQAVLLTTPITFVGRNVNGPQMVDNMTFPRGHEGYSGYTIDTDATHNGISPLVDAAISMFHPHIILLHIGTNDINGNVNIANAPTRLAALLDRIITDAPSALLVVAQIIPTTTDTLNTRISAYNAAIPALVQQRAGMGKHIALLDMYSVFTANVNYKSALMNDVLHPNVTGYATMGDAWYNAIKAVLPKR